MPDYQETAPIGSTLFERMQRFAQTPAQSRAETEIPGFLQAPDHSGQHLMLINTQSTPSERAVRFDRATVAGQPGVVMQRRNEENVWHEAWSLPTQSVDAQTGMIGWLLGQRHRWSRLARMLDRKGPEALTNWIFELMVVPSTAHAQPPRFVPQPHITIDQYGRTISHHQPTSVRRARRRDCL